tara:strand:- start:237 stop:518 length:282 start_codon:yes stop_codon:yes gene_type:complete
MAKITKQDIIKDIADAHGTTHDAVRAPIDALLDHIATAMERGDEVALHGFGSFKRTERAARKGRNPRTGEAVDIAASSSMNFKPAKAMKDRLN